MNCQDGLSQEDWNFDPVPEEELHVCCIWEYGRESNFLCSIRERSAEASRLGLSVRERLDFVERDFSKAFSALGRSAIFFQSGIYGLGGEKGYPSLVSRFPAAWQSLDKSERTALLETADWDATKATGLPAFRRSTLPRAKAIVELFRPKSMKEVFGVDEGLGVREYFHAGHKLRSLSPCYMYASGQEVLLVEIDWGRFTNEELVKEFAQWLKENNPPGIVRPDRRGQKKISDRVKLERLGLLRLLHHFTLAQVKTACPDAWDRYHSPNRRWNKDAVKAGLHFRELFPFLPENEQPLSWSRKQERRR
jgi:hypothetical protein